MLIRVPLTKNASSNDERISWFATILGLFAFSNALLYTHSINADTFDSSMSSQSASCLLCELPSEQVLMFSFCRPQLSLPFPRISVKDDNLRNMHPTPDISTYHPLPPHHLPNHHAPILHPPITPTLPTLRPSLNLQASHRSRTAAPQLHESGQGNREKY